jgi:hypothetical protein
MIRRLLLSPYVLAEPFLEHRNWIIRGAAQATVLCVASVRLGLRRGDAVDGDAPDPSDGLVRQLSASTGLRDFLLGRSIVKRFVGRLYRALLWRLSVAAKARERARPDQRNFALRLTGPIDQKAMRNLLIWQNHVLPSYLRPDDNRQVDVALVISAGLDNEPRLFDLISIVLMLERFRNFVVFWDEETAADAASILMSDKELAHWRAAAGATDLGKMPRDITGQVELHGTRGGVKLLQHGRKYANDFFKLAFPRRFVIAVALREREDGTAEPDELELWLGLIDTLRARHSDVAFVVLNCLAPSQWQEWPAHVRFARHQGLTLQDAVCLAQTADGYFGVLDVFGLAAHSAGRPGVYVPLDDADLPRGEAPADVAKGRMIMVGSLDHARIEGAMDEFFASPRFRSLA